MTNVCRGIWSVKYRKLLPCYWPDVRLHEKVYGMKTNDDQGALQAVEALFPKSSSTIQALFETKEGFRELCGDYVECINVLKNLRQGLQVNENANRLEQYCELRASLETELLNRLSEPSRR